MVNIKGFKKWADENNKKVKTECNKEILIERGFLFDENIIYKGQQRATYKSLIFYMNEFFIEFAVNNFELIQEVDAIVSRTIHETKNSFSNIDTDTLIKKSLQNIAEITIKHENRRIRNLLNAFLFATTLG